MRTSSLSKHFYTSKNFRVYFVDDGRGELRIVTPKKVFRLAVHRNKIRRRLKEIYRTNDLWVEVGSFVFVIYAPFAELSFEEASFEVVKAVKSSFHNKVLK